MADGAEISAPRSAKEEGRTITGRVQTGGAYGRVCGEAMRRTADTTFSCNSLRRWAAASCLRRFRSIAASNLAASRAGVPRD